MRSRGYRFLARARAFAFDVLRSIGLTSCNFGFMKSREVTRDYTTNRKAEVYPTQLTPPILSSFHAESW